MTPSLGGQFIAPKGAERAGRPQGSSNVPSIFKGALPRSGTTGVSHKAALGSSLAVNF